MTSTEDVAALDHDDERSTELAALVAIYPEIRLSKPSKDTRYEGCAVKLSIELQVAPIEPLQLEVPKSLAHQARNGDDKQDSTVEQVSEYHELRYLPELQVTIQLPAAYPVESPPTVRLNTGSSWLAKETLHDLEHQCATLWEDMGCDQVLFAYLDSLREAAEQGFGIKTPLRLSSAQNVALLDFERQARRRQFEQQTFTCDVCIEPKKGLQCYQLQRCSHVFCIPCLRDFYNACITEGDITKVKCLAPKCPIACADKETPISQPVVHIDSILDPSELLQIPLEPDIVQRFVKLRRKRQLEADKNTVYCPRPWCQGPARTKPSAAAAVHAMLTPTNAPDIDHISNAKLPAPADRLAICEDCTFAFCIVCKASWHGEYYTCFPRSQFELSAEEKASEDYLKLHTQACPTCDARAQKTHGCNHMICSRCDTHFCYLCGSYLQRDNPYQHFNDKKIGCFMRLWELEEGDEGTAAGHAFAGGGDGGGGGALHGPGVVNAAQADRDEPLAPIERWIPDEHYADSDSEDEVDEELAAYFAERWAEPIGPHIIFRDDNAPARRDPPPPDNGRGGGRARGNARDRRGRGGRAPHNARGRGRGPGRAGHQRNRAAAAGAPNGAVNVHAHVNVPEPGLQRFLEMVRNDNEDEWDSDEMSDAEEALRAL